jgi:cell division control protein 6
MYARLHTHAIYVLISIFLIKALHRTTTGWLPSTPSSAFAGLSIGTPPTTPSALVPLHVRARGLLRATCNSTSAIAGRNDERTTIASFLHSFAAGTEEDADNAGVSTLYVSGLPGTGKTALVNDILRGMEAEMDGVVLITLNCMALNSADALWDRLQEELGVMKKTKARGRPKKLDVQMSVAKILESSSTKW